MGCVLTHPRSGLPAGRFVCLRDGSSTYDGRHLLDEAAVGGFTGVVNATFCSTLSHALSHGAVPRCVPPEQHQVLPIKPLHAVI